MRRDEVLHVCRAVTGQLGVVRLLALGSQAIHVLVDPDDVPAGLCASVELDLVVLDTVPGQADPAQAIAGALGEGSDFHVTHGYYPDGMTLDEVSLPAGWEGRLRSLAVDRPGHPDAPARVFAPDLADLCAAKLAANRLKDRTFVATVVAAGLVSGAEVADRCALLPAGGGRYEAVTAAASLAAGNTVLSDDPPAGTDAPAPPRRHPSRIAWEARRGPSDGRPAR